MKTALPTAPQRCDIGQASHPYKHTASTRYARLAIAACTLLLVMLAQPVRAAELSLSQSPLFLTSSVEPNIIYLLDDSGSMEWEFMVSVSNGGNSNGLPNIGGWTGNYYILPTANNGYDMGFLPQQPYTIPSEASVTGSWRARNQDFNALYYNPAITYEPWEGVDGASAVLYSDVSASAAPIDPTNPTGTTINLTTTINFTNYWCVPNCAFRADSVFPAVYYVWTDSDSDGVVDAGDGNVRVEIRSTTPTCAGNGNTQPCLQRAYTDEIQNFANWFTYYRKRAYVAKAAIGSVIKNNSLSRMGLQAFNSGLTRNAISMGTPANKTTLWQDLYGLSITCTSGSCPSTPARDALGDLGDLYEGSSSPILSAANGGTCQQNFAVLLGDGFWNGGGPNVGNADGDANNTPFDGGSYADNISNTLADVAMHYYERDLKGGLADEVPVLAGVDNATYQHMVTYSVAFGVAGNLDPFDTKTPGDASDTDPTDSGFSWPDPTDTQDADRIDDMWHAAYNGRGKFLSAQDPQGLAQSMIDALADITNRTGSSAAVAVNSRTLNTDTRIFQARFLSGAWSGELRALPLDANNGTIGAALWDAGAVLNGQNWDSGRTILTYKPGTGGTAFRWTNLTAAQKAYLDTNPATSSNDGRGDERLEYIRGSNSNEPADVNTPASSTQFRFRGYKLGDIIDSGPKYVGIPSYLPADIETDPHPTFRNDHSTRRPMIYVGANDGMVHGFDANTGEERLAYIPSKALPLLNQLTDPNYQHRYFVNDTPTSADAYFKAGWQSTPSWHTLLIGGLGGGGQMIYALDVTDPDGANNSTLAFSENSTNAGRILSWEFTDAIDADLGYTYGKPTIAKMHNGKWAAIFGNGYNNTEADGNASSSGHAVLYIVFLEDAANGNFVLANDDYIKIDTLAGSSTTPNGLAEPAAVDIDGDRLIDYIYGGDLLGNMWKFDVSASNTSSWKVAFGNGVNPKPLFQAVDSGTAVPLPITTRPEVSQHPDNLGGYMVYFGTGKFLENGDTAAGSETQAYFGIWDKDVNSNTTPVVLSNLLAQAITETTLDGTATGRPVRRVTNVAIDWKIDNVTGTHLGWRTDLYTTGERIISTPVLIGGSLPRILFVTTIPETGSCSGGGSSWIMEVSTRNGGAVPAPIFDTDEDGAFTNADLINGTGYVSGIQTGNGISTTPTIIHTEGKKLKYTSGSTGEINKTDNPDDPKGSGRQSWRQLQ